MNSLWVTFLLVALGMTAWSVSAGQWIASAAAARWQFASFHFIKN
jgi:hypothetical protein